MAEGWGLAGMRRGGREGGDTNNEAQLMRGRGKGQVGGGGIVHCILLVGGATLTRDPGLQWVELRGERMVGVGGTDELYLGDSEGWRWEDRGSGRSSRISESGGCISLIIPDGCPCFEVRSAESGFTDKHVRSFFLPHDLQLTGCESRSGPTPIFTPHCFGPGPGTGPGSGPVGWGSKCLSTGHKTTCYNRLQLAGRPLRSSGPGYRCQGSRWVECHIFPSPGGTGVCVLTGETVIREGLGVDRRRGIRDLSVHSCP
eukprot:766205-Hanusia_phi.AAC.1